SANGLEPGRPSLQLLQQQICNKRWNNDQQRKSDWDEMSHIVVHRPKLGLCRKERQEPFCSQAEGSINGCCDCASPLMCCAPADSYQYEGNKQGNRKIAGSGMHVLDPCGSDDRVRELRQTQCAHIQE